MNIVPFKDGFTLKHFKYLFFETQYWLWFKNTFIIALWTTLLTVVISSLSAYVFSRFKFVFKHTLLMSMLILQIFPSFVGMIAIYVILNRIGGLDTLWGLVLVYVAGGIPYNTWMVKSYMAQKKSIVDEAYPGDIVGIPDTGNFKIGDTLVEGSRELHFKGLPSFSPEMFKYIENTDPMKSKQLDKGLHQLMDEGVAQLFTNQFNGRKIVGTVGQLQFEVIQYRLLHEYGAQCHWEPISLYKACWIESDNDAALEAFKKRKYQYIATDTQGRDVFLADSNYVLQMAQHDFPDIKFHFTSEF